MTTRNCRKEKNMGFIKLTQISNVCLQLRKDQEFVLKERYKKISAEDKEKVSQVFKDFEHLWIPHEESRRIEILINTDEIERCEEMCAASGLISEADWVYLPRVSRVFLKGGKNYLVFENARKIQSLIETASQK